jgi:hypothetical protein
MVQNFHVRNWSSLFCNNSVLFSSSISCSHPLIILLTIVILDFELVISRGEESMKYDESFSLTEKIEQYRFEFYSLDQHRHALWG